MRASFYALVGAPDHGVPLAQIKVASLRVREATGDGVNA